MRPIVVPVLAALVSGALGGPAPSPAVARSHRAGSQPLVLRGAGVFPGVDTTVLRDGVVVIEGRRIRCVGTRGQCDAPPNARAVDVTGRWIVPGLVDAHVHFSQTGWVDGRPDAVDLRDRHPYPRVVADLQEHPERSFRAYLCSGVTAVFDVGGYPWTWSLRDRGETDAAGPRIAAAGPLLSTIDFWLNLPAERQFLHMAGDSAVREAVAYHAANGSDAVKVWYIMPPQPPDTARAEALVRAAGEEARRRGVPLIVHATGLREAKSAIRAGARLLVHSVFEGALDDEFLRLAREGGVLYTPTLMVLEGYADVYRNGFDGSRYPLACADPGVRRLATAGIPPDRVPERPGYAAGVRRRLETGMANALRAFEEDIPVVVGTDAGNPGTLHGPAIHREMELLQEAGLPPAEVLLAATRNGAAAMGREDEIGTLESGKLADLLVLTADPLEDVRNVRHLERVMKDGVLLEVADLLPRGEP